MQPAELVAVWIAEVGQVELSERTLAQTGRVLDGRSPGGYAGIMPGADLFGRFEIEADGGAIAVARLSAVERRTHHQHRSVVPVIDPLFVLHPGTRADRVENGVVKAFRPIDVVASDHHVTEHFCLPL